MKSPEVRGYVGGICANAPLCAALIRSVARAWGFELYNTEPIVKEEGLINLSCLDIYHLSQSTYFDM